MEAVEQIAADVKALHDEVIAERDRRIQSEVRYLRQIVKALEAMTPRGRGPALRYLMRRYEADL